MARLFIAIIAIQGASKMHRTEVDLVPVGCVLDELSRIDGLPRDATAPIMILDEAERLHAADRLRAIQSLRWDVRACFDHGIGRKDAREVRDRLAANEAAIPIRSALARSARRAERGCRMPAHFRLITGSAISEVLT